MDYQLNVEERTRLAALVMEIFNEWELDVAYQKALLGMEEGSKELSRYRHGLPFPEEPELIERARHVVGIQQALMQVFPLNRRMPSFWLYNSNRKLRGMPMEIMVSEGLEGMNRVWHHLDCTANW